MLWGGGDWQEDRLIPDCIRALSQRKPIVLRNPEAIRPWQHVLEPLYGYLLLAHKVLLSENPSLYAQAWNFGPFERDQAKVREVVERIIKLWGGGEYQILDNPPFYEAKILRLDISKALIELGWKPKWDLKITLEKTINWYKTFYEGLRNMRKLTETQIEEYEKG
ncbi:MAG: hypothetical protein N3A56_03130 [Thermodesulfobacteriaceae bacterium]|nr:hypothetical protein [Thermodesulfobacteriaceae bacterium]